MVTTLGNGACLAPFMEESLFPATGGFVGGRFCQDITALNKTVSCCLPCPLASWVYDDASQKTTAASWFAVGLFPLSAFLLLSYATLSEKWSHRHYISICLTLAVCFLQIAFIIPLGTKPQQCYNDITPNDMTSSLSCAVTGSFVVFGGLAVPMWSLCRTVALHLQVCWEMTIGSKFMWMALLVGWGVPAISLTLVLFFTGVSFRFGDTCHINSQYSLVDFWVPMLVITAATLVLQFITLGYCIHIYVKSLLDRNMAASATGTLPSYAGSGRALTTRQAYKRIRGVIQLQWRSIALVLTLLGHVIFFAVIFLTLDSDIERTSEHRKKASQWAFCLALSGGDKSACFSYAQGLAPNKAAILAVLFLLPMSGFWNFFYVIRGSMVLGWADLFKHLFIHNDEFASTDARSKPPSTRTYKMLSVSKQQVPTTPDPSVTVPGSPVLSLASSSSIRSSIRQGPNTINSFGREANYLSPALSFSSPQPPTAVQVNTSLHWDHTSSFAP